MRVLRTGVLIQSMVITVNFLCISDSLCIMTHLFSKKSKTSNDITKVPQEPTIDQIVEDLESAKPDDIVFTTDIGLVDLNTAYDLQKPFSLPPRFQEKAEKQEDSVECLKSANDHKDLDGLYENVIQFNQNVEKLVHLQQTLPKVLDNLEQLHEELNEDKNCVKDTYKQALELHQEINTKDSNIHQLN